VGVRFVGALLGWTVCKEDQGTDELIPPLALIDKAQLELRKVTGRFHERSFTQAHCGPHGRSGGESGSHRHALVPCSWCEPWALPARSVPQMVGLREGAYGSGG
jgi:hypothetical protein